MSKHCSTMLVVALSLAGCAGDDVAQERTWIAPLDGQSGIPLDMQLMVRTGELDLPPDYPIPNLIRVVDLRDGGEVPGRVEVGPERIRFIPDEGWVGDRRFAWTVDPVNPVPHGPELVFPEHLAGTAVFDTSSSLSVLGAALDDEGRACLVFSRRLTADDDAEVNIDADGVPVDEVVLEYLPEEAWSPWVLAPDDPGLDVICLTTPETFEPGTVIRVWWGEPEVPWRAELQGIGVDELVVALRRGVF